MASQFTNRLVGTIALVALGVIFLPDLLDGEKKKKTEPFAVIPVKPDVAAPSEESTRRLEKLLTHEPRAAASAADQSGAAQTQQQLSETELAFAGDTQVAEPTTEQPVQAGQSGSELNRLSPPEPLTGFDDSAWVIQLGGFKNATNVKALVEQLRKAGFTAYTQPNPPINGKITRVFVGPNVDRGRLETMLPALKKLTGLSGEIYAYNPVSS